MKKLTSLVLALLLLAGLVYCYICYQLSHRIIYPPQRTIETLKTNVHQRWGQPLSEVLGALPSPVDFSIPSMLDSALIKGWYFRQDSAANCGVVLAHGWSDNRLGVLNYGMLFWDCGCDLIVFDHRAHNESGGDYATGGIREKYDLLTVSNYLQKESQLSDDQLAWMGVSWGAAVALQAGAMDKKVRFIVAESPFQDWYAAIFERAILEYGEAIKWLAPGVLWMVNWQSGIDYRTASPLKAASKIQAPVLLIHSQSDAETASSQSVQIARQLNSENSQFHHLDWGAGHTKNLRTRPGEYRSMIYQFIQSNANGFGNCN